jgi:glucokinase
MVDLLEAQDFRAAFEDRAPYVEFARKIPVSLLMAKDTVLAGLAAIARQPEAYAIDYAARLWR